MFNSRVTYLVQRATMWLLRRKARASLKQAVRPLASVSLSTWFGYPWRSTHTAHVRQTNWYWTRFGLFMLSAARYTDKWLVRPRGEGEEKEVEEMVGSSLSYSHSVKGRIRKVLACDDPRDGGPRALSSTLSCRPSFPSELKWCAAPARASLKVLLAKGREEAFPHPDRQIGSTPGEIRGVSLVHRGCWGGGRISTYCQTNGSHTWKNKGHLIGP